MVMETKQGGEIVSDYANIEYRKSMIFLNATMKLNRGYSRGRVAKYVIRVKRDISSDYFWTKKSNDDFEEWVNRFNKAPEGAKE